MGEGRAASRHLGLDLGGTNIKSVVMERDGDGWRTLDRGEVPTLADQGPDAVIDRLAAVGSRAAARCAGVSSIGIGVPGRYDPDAGSTRFLPNLPGDWTGKPVAASVGRALDVPAHLINDARAFGLAELRLGAGRGASTLIGFVLGTGVGGVVAVDGRIHLGHDGTAGELGHQTIEPDGPPCGCGNRGCVEAFCRADRIAAACGAASVEDCVERARAGDELAVGSIAQAGHYLGIGIANMVSALTPDRVVIGGGVSAAGDLLVWPIREELRRRVRLTPLEGVEVVIAELGSWAGAIGAAIHGAEARGAAHS